MKYLRSLCVILSIVLTVISLSSVAFSEGSPLTVGSIVEFGVYEQDGNSSNGPEPIEWVVLDIIDGYALIITTVGIEAISYSKAMDINSYSQSGLNWETCALRDWMNNDFYKTAFSDDEKAFIAETEISTKDAYDNFTTTDKVFALSIEEADKYFSNAAEMGCEATASAISGLNVDSGAITSDGFCCWWLRDLTSSAAPQKGSNFMSGTYNEAAFISGQDGTKSAKNHSGMPVFCDYLCTARPAIFVSLEVFSSDANTSGTDSASSDSANTPDDGSIDLGLIESCDLYEYDESENKWRISGWYRLDSDDYYFSFGVMFWSSYISEYSPDFRVSYLAKETKDNVNTMTVKRANEIRFLLDNTVYAFKNLELSETVHINLGGYVLRTLLKVLPTAEKIAIELELDDGNTVTIEQVNPNDLVEIFEIAKILEDSNIWNISTDYLDEADAQTEAYIDGYVPSDEEIEEMIKNKAPIEPFAGDLSKGSKGETVRVLQQRLIDLNYLNGNADGDFGNMTKNAVIAFQTTVGIEASGEVDETTWNALFSTNAPSNPEE